MTDSGRATPPRDILRYMTESDSVSTDGSLTARTLTGVRWTAIAVGVSALLQLVYSAAISRLLDPAAFGLVAVAQIALRFGSYFARMGVSQALVQRRDLTDDDVRAGFTSGTLLGLVFVAVFWVAAPAVAPVFDAPGVVPVLRALSLTLLLHGLAMTAQSLLQRTFRFRELAVVDLVTYAIGYLGVGLASAVAGAGVWSLVAATLTQAALSAAWCWALTRHPLRPLLRGDLYGYGGRISVIGFFEWLGEHVDNLAVGRFAGVAALGAYNRAYVLVSLPLYRLTTALTDVLFPGLAQLQDEPDRLRRTFTSAAGLAAAMLFPTCTGIALSAPQLVFTVLGPQWGSTVAVLPWLALATAFHFLSTFAGVVCEATARLGVKLALEGVYLAALAATMLAVAGGPIWVYAATLAGGEVVRHVAYVLVLRRIVDLDAGALVRRYVPAAATAALTAVPIAAARAALPPLGVPAALVLVAEITAGALALAACLRYGPLWAVRRDLRDRLPARTTRLLLGS
jgi:lipopolysaccharide exporter